MRKIDILDFAYKNDFIDTSYSSEKYLNDLLRQGLLTNKHKHHRLNYYVYWITEKGIKYLKNHNEKNL